MKETNMTVHTVSIQLKITTEADIKALKLKLHNLIDTTYFADMLDEELDSTVTIDDVIVK